MSFAMKSADRKPRTRSQASNPSLAGDLANLGRVLRSLFDPYRPERHYMRGPGPKWHAKHGPARAIGASSAAPVFVPVSG